MIILDNVSVRYNDEQNEICAVNKVSLEIPYNEFVSITGRSGSGKSTLLSTIGGLLQPSEGNVVVGDSNIYMGTEKEITGYRRDKVGFIFQAFNLEENYTVYQNIEIALMISQYPRSLREKRIKDVLECVGISTKRDTVVKKLSGGEKQRVCIARAIANEPEIILADEPCGNLDSKNGQVVMDLLRKFVKKNSVVILVTHNLEDAHKTDRIIEMRDGIVISDEYI